MQSKGGSIVFNIVILKGSIRLKFMCNSFKYQSIFYTWVFVLCFLTGCKEDGEYRRPTPEVAPVSIDIIRMEQLICNPTDSRTPAQLMELYPVFSDVFFHQIIYPQNTASIELDDLVSNFCSAPAIQHLIDTTKAIFPNLDHLEKELGQAFGYFQHYFPNHQVPQVYTYVSEFGIGTFTIDTEVVGIGLDFFLGSGYPYYDPAVFPNYMVQVMTPEYISVNAIQALAQSLIEPTTAGNMLDQMIFNGKTHYIASRLLPGIPMHRLFLYTPEQMDWVENNELQIWSYFLDLNYFYENDPRKFRKFVDPSPTSPGMPEEAPGRVANWIGYRIVEAYMNRHPEITLPQLAEETDYQSIVDQSQYKPRRPG